MAFNAKNLHYEKQEPAFLRRLKGITNASDGRHNIQIARPKKDRLKTGDGEDDEPLIVDEQGKVIDKAEFEYMQKGSNDDNTTKRPDGDDDSGVGESNGGGDADGTTKRESGDQQRMTQRVVEVGGPKKRKQARVVGDDDDDVVVVSTGVKNNSISNQDDKRSKTIPTPTSTSMSTTTRKSSDVGAKEGEVSTTKPDKSRPPKKKVKKIKLSFDDPE